jgi:hypothetical protein
MQEKFRFYKNNFCHLYKRQYFHRHIFCLAKSANELLDLHRSNKGDAGNRILRIFGLNGSRLSVYENYKILSLMLRVFL